MKKIYMLDTNIVSEFSKIKPNVGVMAFYSARKEMCAISAITWQELNHGVERMPEGKRRNSLQNFIENIEANMDIIPYDKFSAQVCGEIQAKAERSGRTPPYYDSQIAAAAISNGMVLVTHNVADFEAMRESCFLRVEDWFRE